MCACESVTVTFFFSVPIKHRKYWSRRKTGGLPSSVLNEHKGIGSLVPRETRKAQYLSNHAGREVDRVAGSVAYLFWHLFSQWSRKQDHQLWADVWEVWRQKRRYEKNRRGNGLGRHSMIANHHSGTIWYYQSQISIKQEKEFIQDVW